MVENRLLLDSGLDIIGGILYTHNCSNQITIYNIFIHHHIYIIYKCFVRLIIRINYYTRYI